MPSGVRSIALLVIEYRIKISKSGPMRWTTFSNRSYFSKTIYNEIYVHQKPLKPCKGWLRSDLSGEPNRVQSAINQEIKIVMNKRKFIEFILFHP